MQENFKKVYRGVYRFLLFLNKRIPWLNRRYPTLPSGVVTSIREWMLQHDRLDRDYHILHAPSPQEKTNFGDGDNAAYQSYANLQYREEFVAHFSDVVVTRNGGILIDQGSKKMYAESFSLYPAFQYIEAYPFYDSVRKFAVCELPGPAFYVYASGNYYHFHCEVIPRVLQMRQFNPGVIIYTGRMTTEWQRQALDFFGITDLQVIPDDAEYLHIRDYYFASYPGLELNTIGRDMLAVMQKRVARAMIASGAPGTWPERIYISRERARHRKVTNESKLRQLLEEQYGFTTLYMEDFTVEEQYLHFARARVVVTVHGPSLTNTIACNKASIVELSNEFHLISCYYRLANNGDNRYILLKCRNASAPVRLQQSDFYGFADIEVDLARLDKILADVCR